MTTLGHRGAVPLHGKFNHGA